MTDVRFGFNYLYERRRRGSGRERTAELEGFLAGGVVCWWGGAHSLDGGCCDGQFAVFKIKGRSVYNL